MSIGNTADQWSLLSKILHWLTALLIFIQIPLGFYAESLKLSALKMDVFIWHKSVGMLVFLLLILRLLWRIKSTIPEAFGISQIQRRLGQLAHGLLYGLMVFWLIPLPALVGPDEALKALAAEVHETCVLVLLVTLLVHIGAALRHHLLLRDDVLKRMWF